MNENNRINFPDGWAEGWNTKCGKKSLFNKRDVYILVVENDLGAKNDYVGCIWNGEDFCPLKAIRLIYPYIKSLEPINNRIKILSVRRI